MKKNFSLTLLATALFVSTNAFAAYGNTYGRSDSDIQAPDRVGKWDLGLGIAAGMNDEVDDGAFVYGQISYGVTPYIGLGIEAGWQEADGSAGETFGVVPVMADIILRIPTVHEALVPYGILGLGGAGVYAELDNQDDVDDTAFAWKLGAGADYFINPNWIFNFEFAYWSAGVTLPNTAITDDFDWWTVGVSLKYVF